MDFIERILHVSPDGGNGVTEMAILAVILVAIVVLGALRAGSRARKMLTSHR